MRILILLMVCSASTVWGQAAPPIKDFNNGCGSGWNEPLVPDEFKPLCIDFKMACAAHDNCYSRCLPGGIAFEQPVCKLTAADQRAHRRLSCDNNFLGDMEAECRKCDPIRGAVCSGVATFYRLAVRFGGGGSFFGYQIPRDFLTYLTTPEGQKFDLVKFENDLSSVASIPKVLAENRLELTVVNEQPIVKFIAINPRLAQRQFDRLAPGLYVREAMHYGQVDLSEATINSQAITIKDFTKKNMIENLDLQQLKAIKTYSGTALGK